MRQIDTTHPPDLSCDYIEHNVTKKPGTIYGGSRTFLSDKHCCNRYSLPLFASTTGHLGLYRSKKNWWRHDKNRLTDLNVKSLHPTPTAKKKFSQQGTLYNKSTFPREPDIVRYLLTQAFTLHQKFNNYQIKVKDFFYSKNLEDIFSDPSEIIYNPQEKCHVIALLYNDYLYLFVKYTSNRLVFVLSQCTGSVWKTDGHYVETEAWF